MCKQALCIGINNYPGTDSDLSGCVNDARDWSEVLEQRGFTVAQLLDKDATKAAIVSEIRRLVEAARYGHLVVITYSGHGSYVPDEDGDESDGADEVLCPWDVEQGNVLSDDELHELFSERARGVRIALVSDSCHSGTVARFAPMLEPDEALPRVRFLPPSVFLPRDALDKFGLRARAVRRSASPPGRHQALLLSGCQDTELSYDARFRGRPNGAFTYAALRALERLPEDATYRDWHKAIRKKLPTASYPQTPGLYGATYQKRWRIFD
jgi:hypothetical protein